MRLLDTRTGLFVFAHDPRQIRYAIVSHTWDPNGEQSYQVVLEIHKRYKHIFAQTPPHTSDDATIEVQPDPIYDSMAASGSPDDSPAGAGKMAPPESSKNSASADDTRSPASEDSAESPDSEGDAKSRVSDGAESAKSPDSGYGTHTEEWYPCSTPRALSMVGGVPMGDLPPWEEQRCIGVSSRFRYPSTNPKWAVFELHGPTQKTVRTLRISFRRGERGDPSEIMRARVALELSEPHMSTKISEGPSIPSDYTPVEPDKDRVLREHQGTKDTLMLYMWRHWSTSTCVHAPEGPVFERSAALVNMLGEESNESRCNPWQLW
ncbi:hypothetical protein DICSQDRAFT_128333 [Dichomitus squalens LYAD-421 SS1]|uniref:Uncharacterized protein n=1 Tax=Dichomitus squalens (strain LYAD-421) TaxID=732165 RepID=R7STS9_DICSQ|nr:uncharacterized protein DICSQDRAFT_128333 [Dichomitus squalens LYAD-421 SS1]EJF59308.1 hypothetical protein DICSQDRAFT_128333 [Dichomitus squalens LYAD-421 SS1]